VALAPVDALIVGGLCDDRRSPTGPEGLRTTHV
jgi:hypothetical protein